MLSDTQVFTADRGHAISRFGPGKHGYVPSSLSADTFALSYSLTVPEAPLSGNIGEACWKGMPVQVRA